MERKEAIEIQNDIGNMISPFIKIKQLPELPHNNAYKKLTKVMVDYYELYKTDPQIRLYEVMQCVDKNKFIAMNEMELEEFLGFEHVSGDAWDMVRSELRQDRDWYYIKAKKTEEGFKIGPMYIKVTISTKEDYGVEIFLSIIRELLKYSQNEFQGKLTKHHRLETMVFWVNRSEFCFIENFLKTYDDVLITPLIFTGYRDKLAVSRDLYSWGSHNSRQMELMKDYFKFVDDREKISLEGMYQFLIDSWNDVLDNSGKNPYAQSDAQLLIILLESLFVILGEHKITDNHIFLQQDMDMWEHLGRNCSWDDYEEWRSRKII